MIWEAAPGVRIPRADDLFPEPIFAHTDDVWKPTPTNRPGVFYISWRHIFEDRSSTRLRDCEAGEAFTCEGRNWRVVRIGWEYDGYFVVPHEWPCWDEDRLFWLGLWERIKGSARVLRRLGGVWRGWPEG